MSGVDVVAVLECARDDRDRRGDSYVAEQAAAAAVSTLLSADREYDAALSNLIDLNRRIAEHGWMEVEHDALREAGTRLVRAQERRRVALQLAGGDA